nr:glycosyltransferase family 39 protein [uncultured Desulfuromonas sp.]
MREFLLRHRALLLIMALSFSLKLLFLWQGEVVNPDSATYIAAAQKHAQGMYAEGLRYYQMPFYPLLLAGMHAVFPNWIVAGQLLTVIPLVLCLWPLYAVTSRLFDRHAAAASTLLFAVLPSFNVAATSIKRDPLFLLFSVTALLCLVLCYQERRWHFALLFVLMSVLAILTRIEGVLLPLVGVLSFFLLRRKLGWSRKAVIGYLVAVSLLPVTLWAILAAFQRFGIVSPSRLDELALWGKSLMSLDFLSGYQHMMARLKEIQQTLPGDDLHNNLLETTRHYAPLIYALGLLELLGKALFPTSLVALWARRGQRVPQVMERSLLTAVIAGVLLLNLLFSLKSNFTTERYVWLAVVGLVPWVGQGIIVCVQRFGTRTLGVLLVLVFFIGTPLAATFEKLAAPQDRTVVFAGEWLKTFDSQDELRTFYNDRRLPLYSHRVADVNRVRSLEWLQLHGKKRKDIDFIALYLSNKKNETTSIDGFQTIKTFSGAQKTVVLLQRVNN